MKILFSILIILHSGLLHAQSRTNEGSLSLGIGNEKASISAGYHLNWKVGKKERLTLGTGLRVTSFFGRQLYYQSAPATITSGKTGPGVFFTENITENIDSLQVSNPQMNALNAIIAINYDLSNRFSIRFSIDAIGFTLGPKRNGNYINGQTGSITESKPTAFNLLLISDNDLGTLNSDLLLAYQLNEQIKLSAGFQFLFTEYTTSTQVQQLPEPNDRFRNKAAMASFGFIYSFRK